MNDFIFGIDIGGTSTKIGLFESQGLLIDKWEIPTDTSENGANILHDIAHFVFDKLESISINKKDCKGIGLGIPGPVLYNGVVQKCVNLGWDVFNVEEALTNLTGIFVKAGNDANVAALGELWKGAAFGYHNVVMITLGTGVGGGIIINDEILSGSNGTAGEIGHLKVNTEETVHCACGGTGCLEQYASANGFVKETKKYLQLNDKPTTLTSIGHFTAKQIFDEAKKGDKIAIKVVDELAKKLAIACVNLSVTVNPKVFIIGGGLSKAGQILIEHIENHYFNNAFHSTKHIPIVLAKLGNDAGIYGAAKMILDSEDDE